MKLAKEIAEDLYPLGRTRISKPNAAIDRRIAEKVISAKLKPVREALNDHYEANKCAAHIIVSSGLSNELAELCEEAGVRGDFRMRGISALSMLSEEDE